MGFVPNLLLTSDKHQSIARNVALDAVREMDDYVVFMDDDDYYGPEYLTEHRECAKHGRLVGKYSHWVRFEGVCTALFRQSRANSKQQWVRAGTLGGFAREFPDFPEQPIAEEIRLCEEFRLRGGEVWNSSISHVLYERREDTLDHAYGISNAGFARVHGPTFVRYPLDCLEYVNGRRPLLTGAVGRPQDFE